MIKIAFILCFIHSFCYGQDAKPFVLGTIREIQSTVLQEKRILNIYLPPGYNEKDTAQYPVIYVLDGSADEDFIHISGLVQFCSFEWVNILPPSIVVGIATIDRRRDLTFPSTIPEEKIKFPSSGYSNPFMNFIEQELQPYVNKHFKTNSSNTIIGESLAGLFATEILLKRTKLFNNYIIVSPSLWWNNGSLLEQIGNIKDTANVYIGVGKEGLAPSKMPHVMEVDANLLADKLKLSKSLKVFFDYLPNEDHATIMHQAVFNAFKIMKQ